MGKINLSKLQTMAPMPTKNNATNDNVITKEDATMAQNSNIATVNNNSKEATMNNINANISTGKATEGEFAISYQGDGYGALIPIIDGVPHKELMMGYVSERDAQAGIELLGKALKATNGDIPAAMRYMYTAASVAAADIKPTEKVKIPELDAEFLIDYEKKAICYYDDEKANLDDLDTTNWPNEAIKAMLITRAKEKWEQEEEGTDNLLNLFAGLM
jgi:hypothetical protein